MATGTAPELATTPLQAHVRGDEREKPVLAKRLAIGFIGLSAAAIALCGLLLWLIRDVADRVVDMRHHESAIRRSVGLAAAVRDQSRFLTQALLAPENAEIEAYERALAAVQGESAALRGQTGEGEAWRIDEILAISAAIDDRFMACLWPSASHWPVSGHDLDPLNIAGSFRELQELSQRAAAHADALARSVEAEMADAHVNATATTHLALLAGAAGALLMLTWSIAFTVHLRAAWLRPLQVLVAAARRFGSGHFESRVGDLGQGELRALARALDHMAEELALRERRLVESERMAAIGQLAAGVAHELNNPIAIIRGYLETMRPDAASRSLREEIEILDEEAAHCQRIAEDLLAYARLPHMRRELVELAGLIEKTIQRVQEMPEAQGIRFALDLTPGTIFGDAARLRQVIVNLVLNAIEAARSNDAGTASVDITGVGAEDEGYVIAVADTGLGIAAEDRARIFEPFFSRRRGGSGLGLAVCSGIVEMHGGTITVEPRPRGGTIFRVRLPRRAPDRESSHGFEEFRCVPDGEARA